MELRASCQAGYKTATKAKINPIKAAPTSKKIVALLVSVLMEAMVIVAKKVRIIPNRMPPIPTIKLSTLASCKIWRVDAPRVRRSACSKRRRSLPVAVTAKVSNIAKITPGIPKNKNSTLA